MRGVRNLAVAMGMAALVPVANAIPVIVTDWNYTVESHFASPVLFQPITGSGAGPISACGAGGLALVNNVSAGPNCATPDTLAWGNTGDGATNVPGATQSKLRITGNPANDLALFGPIKTDFDAAPSFGAGEIGRTQIFSHDNFVITNDSWTLRGSQVNSFLSLNPLLPNDNPPLIPGLPPNGTPFLPPLNIPIFFDETPNEGTCAKLPPPPGGPPAANPCPDVFVIVGGINNFEFWYNATTFALYPGDPGLADPDAVRYIVQIFPINGAGDSTVLSTLSDEECQQAGANVGCQGFITAEGTTTNQPFGFAITTRPISVPEPGMLALLALGLVGMGFTIRRRAA